MKMTNKQKAVVKDLMPKMRIRKFFGGDGVLIVDCGDKRPIVIEKDGRWDFVGVWVD